ncbi:MAG: response regulator [Deltaproteobacteria bacterium]|nr:response regulator [Deltaproteobacteria bacterium]
MKDSDNPVLEQRIKVLIADDDEVCREILEDAIRKEGAEVVLASDGVEALDRLSQEPADILVSDLNMPRMDGLTLLKHARQQHPQILTIIITGYGSLQSAIEAIRLGAYDYIQKPFRIEEITVATRNAIDKVRILREKTFLLKELENLHQKLELLEAARNIRSQEEKGLQAANSKESSLCLFSGIGLPLRFLEVPDEDPSRVLNALENLKELRRDGTISEHEFLRIKKFIIEKIESSKP